MSFFDHLVEEIQDGNGINMTTKDLYPFYVPDFHSLDPKIVNGFSKGKKVVIQKVDTAFVQNCIQLAIRDSDKNDTCFILYLSLMDFHLAMYANISEWHKKIIDMYGKFDGYNFYLDTNRSKTKAPVFTQFFLESDFEPNKTFFVCKDLRVFLACAKPYDSFDTDKDFFNVIISAIWYRL